MIICALVEDGILYLLSEVSEFSMPYSKEYLTRLCSTHKVCTWGSWTYELGFGHIDNLLSFDAQNIPAQYFGLLPPVERLRRIREAVTNEDP